MSDSNQTGLKLHTDGIIDSLEYKELRENILTNKREM